MGGMKELLMEQAEKQLREELHANFVDWFWGKYGRSPSEADKMRTLDDYELEKAFEHAMSKDD